MPPPRVFTIPPDAPFLDRLVEALLDGRLVPDFRPADPFALADTTLYLPTRRAARAVRESFLRRLGRPVLLPRIRTLGDIDEDDPEILIRSGDALPPAVPRMERQLVLARLVMGWSGALVRSLAGLPDEELIVPSSPADAVRLAGSLAGLLDQVGTERSAWQELFADAEGDHARYWAITLEFLKIVTEFWPAHLAERGMIDPGARRDLMIRGEAARLLRDGSPAPIVAAGSTGSVPATAALLSAIARLPNGAVVLPGLDQDLDDEAWEAIGIAEREPEGAGHPQYGLKLLLQTLGSGRGEVISLADAAESPSARVRFVSEAMRPASTTQRWSEDPALSPQEKRDALQNVGMIEAANEREEALAVAVLLRRSVETAGNVAALVTPDRGLARRVGVELRRWDIDVDDSAGRPLGLTPPGIFARLVAEVGLRGAVAEPLLALLKHPLALFGLEPSDARWAARSLERAVLRGPRLREGIAPLRHALDRLHAERWASPDPETRGERRTAAQAMSRDAWERASDLAGRVETALAPLEALSDRSSPLPLAGLVEAHFAACVASAAGAGRRASPLFGEEAGEALALAFEHLRASAASGPDIAAADYPALFGALIERTAVRRRGGTDPRIHIWGTLEARLQSVGTVVLGALNEGTWPGQTRLDPLLSRPMRTALKLDPPERRIGLAAHDFSQALGHPEIWLTRADRENGEPRVASRWLQRMTAHAGETLTKEMRRRGDAILALARRLDVAEKADPPVRPRPSPPTAARPRQLSATRIETLIRDPYAIYAQFILKLRPFEPLAKLPDSRERGTLVHDVLEEFVRERPRGPFDAEARKRLIEIGRAKFAEYADFPEIAAFWWPRFEKIARWFVAVESSRPDVVSRHVEAKGRLQAADFELTARADRVDLLADGTLAIIDYKTGAPPSTDEVLSLSPQLPLEALIAERGGFDDIAPAPASQLAYYRLSGRGEGGELHDRTGRPAWGGKPAITLPQILAASEARLNALVALYADPAMSYVSRKIPKRGRVFVGDYDHLARVAEWTTTEEEDDQGFVLP